MRLWGAKRALSILCIYFHLVMVWWDNKLVCTEKTQSFLFLGRACTENRNVQTKSFTKLHSHVTKATKPNDSQRLTRLVHLVAHHWRVYSNPGTKKRCCWSQWIVVWNSIAIPVGDDDHSLLFQAIKHFPEVIPWETSNYQTRTRVSSMRTDVIP